MVTLLESGSRSVPPAGSVEITVPADSGLSIVSTVYPNPAFHTAATASETL
jgi:hypothetical protein